MNFEMNSRRRHVNDNSTFIEMTLPRLPGIAQPLLGSRHDHIPLAWSRRRFLDPFACRLRRRQHSRRQSSDASGEQPAAVAKLADIEMNADTSYLTAEEREVANLLIQVAELINPIYLRQASADNPRIRDEIAAKNDPALLARFDQMMGPWDEMDEDKPFFGSAGAAGRRGLLSRRT